MSKFLVTGGAGFIGAALSKTLLNQGHDVWIIDNLSTGYRSNIPAAASFIEGFCEDRQLLEAMGEIPFDCIFHIAGQSSGEVSFDNPVLDMQANVQSTLVLLQYAHKVNCKKVVFASSMSVYGDPLELPVTELSQTKPKSFYAVGKLASEHYLRIYKSLGIESVSLRLFNVYGPGQNMANLRQGMASIFLAQSIQSNKIVVKGNVQRFRDFVHIDDVVEVFWRSFANDIESGIYNVSAGKKITVQNILDLITDESEDEVKIEVAEGTPGDQFGIYGSADKLEAAVDFQLNKDFSAGFKNMIKWAKTLKN